MNKPLKLYPGNKFFVFSIFDDTDYGALDNVKPIYDLLADLKIYVTKSVWVLKNEDPLSPYGESETLEDIKYLEFIKNLKEKGFEIAFHGVSMDSSKRERTIRAIEKFKELLGFYPKVHTNHWINKENIYWGHKRFNNFFLNSLY